MEHRLDQRLMDRIDRYRDFYSDPSPGRLLIHANWPLPVNVEARAFRKREEHDFSRPEDVREFMASFAQQAIFIASHRLTVDDDYVPNALAHYGQAQNHLFLTDAPVRFEPGTSWSPPVLNNLDEMDKISLNSDGLWYNILLDSAKLLADLSQGKYLVMNCLYGPFDLANALRGDAILTDLHDAPDKVERLLDICANAIIQFETDRQNLLQTEITGLVAWGAWIPGPGIFFSEDVADMCSLEAYEQTARPFTQRIIDAFTGNMIHHHMLGFHLDASMAELQNLTMLQTTIDPNTRTNLDCLDEFIEIYKETTCPLWLQKLNPADVRTNIEKLKQGRFLISCDCENKEQADDIVRFVRDNA